MPERSMWSIDKGVGLRELRALLTVADLGSFRRAATELGYTQSSISHQVAVSGTCSRDRRSSHGRAAAEL